MNTMDVLEGKEKNRMRQKVYGKKWSDFPNLGKGIDIYNDKA